MSKKNSKNQQKSDNAMNLGNQKVAESVAVLLPATISLKKDSNPLLQGYLRRRLDGKKVHLGHNFVTKLMGIEQNFKIIEIDNISEKGQIKQGEFELSYLVETNTIIKLIQKHQQVKKQNQFIKPSFYGFQEELKQLEQSIIHSLFQRSIFINNGLGPLKGILIGGYSGAGKTALLREIRYRLKLKEPSICWKSITSVEMLSRVVGGAESFIKGIFKQIKEKDTCVLVIEDIHLLFGAKEISSNQTALATLLSEMQDIQWEKIVVVASYNSERQLARSIRSSGKFQKEIIVGLPNHLARIQILQSMIEKLSLNQTISLQHLKTINLRLNGFTVGQLKLILRQAFTLWGTSLNAQLLEDMLKKYRPSDIKELIVQVPEVYWNQIGGYHQVKKEIRKVVELPLQHSAKFAKFGIEPSKGILLFGPPGCSKTMMAKAIATQSKLNFIGIKGPELFSKYVGQSERAIRNIFKRARACSPCVIFFDQIDAIATQRSGNTEVSERVLCQLLNEMDGIEGLKEVAIVAATNRPQILDKALMRPGRFDYLIYVSPPDEVARAEIFKIYLRKSIKEELIEGVSSAMASKTANYTGAEISLICRQAVVMALEQQIECDYITVEHLQASLKRFKKRLTQLQIRKYENFSRSLKETSIFQ